MNTVNEIIVFLSQNPYLAALAIVCGISGISLYSVYSSLQAALKKEKQISTSNTQLLKQVSDLKAEASRQSRQVVELNKLMTIRSAEQEAVVRALPPDRAYLHRLFHELMAVSPFGDQIRDAALFGNPHLEAYSGIPAISIFCANVAEYVGRAQLMNDPKMVCARATIAQNLLATYYHEIFQPDPARRSDFQKIFWRDVVDADRLGQDIEQIELMELIPFSQNEEAVLDLLWATKMIVAMNPKSPMAESGIRTLGQSTIAQLEKKIGRTLAEETEKQRLARFSSFPNTSFLISWSGVANNVPGADEQLKGPYRSALLESNQLFGGFAQLTKE